MSSQLKVVLSIHNMNRAELVRAAAPEIYVTKVRRQLRDSSRISKVRVPQK
jgi:hypothetical protein